MTTIYARSPYLVSINQASQVATKVELFIWSFTGSEPVTPTITLSKNIPSLTQIACIYDVAPYIREKIVDDFFFMEDSYNAWTSSYNYVNVRIKRYYKVSGGSFTLLTNTLYNAVNGYGEYQQGANVVSPWASSFPYFNGTSGINFFQPGATQSFGNMKPLFNNNYGSPTDLITTVSQNFASSEVGMLCFLVEKTLPAGTGGTVGIKIGGYQYNIIGPAQAIGSYYIGIPYPYLADGIYDLNIMVNSATYSSLGKVEYLTECKYLPTTFEYVNKFGGIEQFTFFKTRTENFDVSSTSYNLYQTLLPAFSNAYYNQYEGQSKDFNINGSETFKVSSGFVPESYGIRIKELMLSETIKVYDYYSGLRPIKVKSKSLKFQKHINDKNINYELEFEYLNDIINNIS
jgi:hypothetical protein